jgi:phosphatidylinositol phospholipase C delta
MDPMPIWRCGTQVVGMNFQHWDRGTQLNGALFRDTRGYFLKPESLRGGPARTGQTKLKFTVVGADDSKLLTALSGNQCLNIGRIVPHPKTTSETASEQALWEGATYVKLKLYTHGKGLEWRTKTVKEHGGDPLWNESVEWTYQNDDLLFLKYVFIYTTRILVLICSEGLP